MFFQYPYEVKNFLSSPETICETAARLLFMCVRWAKSIPAFVNLDMSDQVRSNYFFLIFPHTSKFKWLLLNNYCFPFSLAIIARRRLERSIHSISSPISNAIRYSFIVSSCWPELRDNLTRKASQNHVWNAQFPRSSE